MVGSITRGVDASGDEIRVVKDSDDRYTQVVRIDEALIDVLKDILIQLKIMNIHNQMITDTSITEEEVRR